MLVMLHTDVEDKGENRMCKLYPQIWSRFLARQFIVHLLCEVISYMELHITPTYPQFLESETIINC